MPPVSPPSEQPELFRSALVNLVDRRHPLVRLASLIDWDRFATAFGPLYREGVGRPGLPTRLMVGLHLCLIPECDGASLTREGEDALWEQFFTAAPEQRRVFEPNSKRSVVTSVNVVENADGLEVATAQAGLGGSWRVSLDGGGLSISPMASTPM